MDDVARAGTKDRMETAVSCHSVTNLSAFAQTSKIGRAEVPAERPLAKIARDRTCVTDLRRCGLARGIRQDQKLFADRGMLVDVGKFHQRADAKAAALFLDIIESRNSF